MEKNRESKGAERRGSRTEFKHSPQCEPCTVLLPATPTKRERDSNIKGEQRTPEPSSISSSAWSPSTQAGAAVREEAALPTIAVARPERADSEGERDRGGRDERERTHVQMETRRDCRGEDGCGTDRTDGTE